MVIDCDIDAKIYQLLKLAQIKTKSIVGPSKKSSIDHDNDDDSKDSNPNKGGRLDVSCYF